MLQVRKPTTYRNVYGKPKVCKHCVSCFISTDKNKFVGSNVISHHFLVTKEEDQFYEDYKDCKNFQ